MPLGNRKIGKFTAVAAWLAIFAGACSLNPSANAHSSAKFATGQPGDPNKAARTVNITMYEDGTRMGFKPARIEVRQGEQIRIVLWNEGSWDHEFMLDSFAGNAKHGATMKKHPEMMHDDPNGKTLGVMEASEILWLFTKAGTFEYACLIPGHYEAGMKGVVVVSPRKAKRSR